MRRMMKSYDFDRCDWVVDHDDGFKGVMPKHILGIPAPILFEGKEVWGVEHPHLYLKQKYGEYMVVPPHSGQRQHNWTVPWAGMGGAVGGGGGFWDQRRAS